MKKIFTSLGIIGLLVVSFYFFMVWQSERNINNEAEKIILQIENHYTDQGSYPTDLNELGYLFDESGPFFYQLDSDKKSYTLYHSCDFDFCKTYYSESNTWGI